jgi:hypothetical protein
MQKVKHELINPQPGKPPKYDNIVIMVGEDRANMPLASALMKAVTKFPGYEHVKVTLETIPRTRPISFTKLRDVLKNTNATPDQQYAVWAQGFNEKKLGKDWILNLMDISRKGMGVVQQPAAAPQAAPQPVAEQRLFNALVRPQRSTSEEAAGVGVVASKKQANDPRYSMSLTKDVRPGQVKKNLKAFSLAEEPDNTVIAQTARRLTDPKDGAVAKLRAAGDKRREDDLKSRNISKKNEEFDSPEYNDEAGMAQSNLLTAARAVKGLIDTIEDRDNLPEWAQEKIAKAEMMLVSVWDYLQSQKELGMDPKVKETMLPKSAFAGSDKNKLGSAAHLKGKMKRPAQQGDLVGGMEEGLGAKLAGLGLAGAMALGAGGAHARVSGEEDPSVNRLTGKPNTTQVAPTDVKPAPEASKGFSKEYLQKAADPNRFGRYMISVEKAQELLMKMNAVDEAKKKGVDGKACWKGYRYAGTKNGKDRCVPVSEDVEQIMAGLIEQIIKK